MTGWLRRGGRLACAWIAAALLAACGGGVGTGGTGSEAQGPITGFGSVIVAGVTWDDTSATVLDDDGNAVVRDGNELRLGMTVEVDGTDGDAPAARTIRLDTTIVGPVASVDAAGRALAVLGQNVRIDAGTVFDESLPNGMASLRPGDSVVVYALPEAAGDGHLATRVEAAPSGAATRLRGRVSAFDAAARTLRIGALELDFDDASNVPAGLGDGMLVRVTLNLPDGRGRWSVASFGRADTPPAEGAQLRVDGLIRGYTGINGFVVNGITVDAGLATVRPVGAVLANGVRVEVRGEVSGGVLRAERLQVMGGNDGAARTYRLNGRIASVNAAQGTFVLRKTVVDYRNAEFRNGTSADLGAGDVVRVEGTLSADGARLVATRVEFR